MKLPNIEYKGDISKFLEASDDEFTNISLYKDIDYFADEMSYSKYVKEIEKLVRTSKEYTAFVSYIKSVLGVNFCQVSSKIYDTDATIEMHHGPLFTLYDICAIILNSFIQTGARITTFRVANKVIDEHFALHVQVVMTTITNHEAVHNRDIFLNLHQGIGNINQFIQDYAMYLDDEQKYKIWCYINMSKNTPSFDRGILDVENIKKFIKL